ncbi:argininosuccinate lyase [Anatilimnocola aggregata]|uniref:Argininosuccinate lyase n=1 Tax=Anatilimnocola aggregata TaxID=2528021 RepID=A0A517YDR1_9BACT|nr:ATP-grasp domain-containing protein [Anatilimnocola aggregata]QDU28358.1 argininosuccinate lyase [Anatilimnocola aggregata]
MAEKGTLIILGASVRAAAESAARGGYQPWGIDLFGDADLQTLGPTTPIKNYPAEFLRALAKGPQAPWIYTGSLENYPRLIARLAKLRPLLGNGSEQLALVRDPCWLAATLTEISGMSYPETCLSPESITDNGWLMKPLRSGSGMGIRKAAEFGSRERGGAGRVIEESGFGKSGNSFGGKLGTSETQVITGEGFEEDESNELNGNFRNRETGEQPQTGEIGNWKSGNLNGGEQGRAEAQVAAGAALGEHATHELNGNFRNRTSGYKDMVWQRFVAGKPLSAAFLASRKSVKLLGVAEQWCGPNWGAPQEFQYAGSLAPAPLTAAEEAALMETATRLVEDAGLIGLFGIDFIRRTGESPGLTLIEVNPRYTASMELYESLRGQSLIAAHCRVVAGEEIESFTEPLSRACRGKLIVYATAAGSAGQRLAELWTSLAEEQVTAADLPCLDSTIEPFAPICTLLTGGIDAGQIGERLLAAAQRVRHALAPLPETARR